MGLGDGLRLGLGLHEGLRLDDGLDGHRLDRRRILDGHGRDLGLRQGRGVLRLRLLLGLGRVRRRLGSGGLLGLERGGLDDQFFIVRGAAVQVLHWGTGSSSGTVCGAAAGGASGLE